MREREQSIALLPAAVAGDLGARGRLIELWGPIVLGWCARIGGPRIDEEDAAHDVFEHVLERIHTLRDPRALPAWIYSTTRRVLIDHRRRAWLRRWVPGFVPDIPDPTAHRLAEQNLLGAKVREALDELPADLREVLVLIEMEERSGVEVAELTGLALGTVKSRLRRARARFEVEARRRGLAPEAAQSVEEDCG